MDSKIERRRRNALYSMIAWYAQIPIATALYFWAPAKMFLAYLVAISIWTGIETSHARRAADLPDDSE